MNANNWWKGQARYMPDLQRMAVKGYPEWKDWPQGVACWVARCCFANREFMPQQTMRGKMALLGYL